LIFYKNLFGLEETFGLKLNDNFWEEEDKENELLEAPFTEEEIKLVVLTPMPREPRDHVVSLLCSVKSVWEVIKGDLMNFARDFEAGKLNLDRLIML
jgi:hypothetical protein